MRQKDDDKGCCQGYFESYYEGYYRGWVYENESSGFAGVWRSRKFC